MKVSLCHPKEKYWCKGLCKKCYLHNYNKLNFSELKNRHKKYEDINKIQINTRRKEYERKNKEKIKVRRLKYKIKLRKSAALWQRLKRKNNPSYKILCSSRARINVILKEQGIKKCARTIWLLGCTAPELRKHLEAQFKDKMSWDNYGRGFNNKKEWHIDHIKPCSVFDLANPEEQQKCFHYLNLQPLWAKENLEKGNKYEDHNFLLDNPK